MVSDLIRDSSFGQIVRLVSRGKFFRYPEEKNPELWKKFLDEEKSGYIVPHGDAEPPRGGDSGEELSQSRGWQTSGAEGETSSYASPASSKTEVDGVGARLDSERARARFGPDAGVMNISRASGVKIDPEKGKDRFIVDWYADDDPENPRNWTRAKRFFVTFEIVLLTFSVYIGSAIYTAGIIGVEQQFGVSQVAATLGLTLYVAGYGLGPMVFAPMSEIPYIGRTPIYIATLLIFVLFQIPTALASNFGMLLAFRFLTGLFGSPALATGGATIADMFRPQKQAYGLAIWGVGAVCGPVLGPLVGGFAVQAKGWTWTIWELMWLSGVCWVFLFFLLPETNSTNILYRKTKRIRQLTGDKRFICEPEIIAEQMTPKEIALMTLVRPITLNFTEPMVFLLNLYIALIYGLLYIWFESFPIVFMEIHHFTLGEEGLAFLGLLVGAISTMIILFSWLYFHQEKQYSPDGTLAPEKLLVPAMLGSFFIPICLFWFGWSAREDVHWILPIIGSSFFSVAAFLLFNSVLPYLSSAYPEYTASVFAGNDLFRSCFGAGFPLFASAMYRRLGVGWASSLLAFLGIAFIPIPFVLYRYGERLRKMSKFAKKDF